MDKAFLTLADGTENALSNGGTFEAIDENNVDGAVFSKDDLTLNGNGKLTVTSPAKHGVVSKDDLVIMGGTYEVTANGQTGAAPDMKPDKGAADNADKPNGTQEGMIGRKGKDGKHQRNAETPSPAPSAPDNAAFI